MSDEVRALLWEGSMPMIEAAARLLVQVEHIAALVTLGACANGPALVVYDGMGNHIGLQGSVVVTDAELLVRLIDATWAEHTRATFFGGKAATGDSAAVQAEPVMAREFARRALSRE